MELENQKRFPYIILHYGNVKDVSDGSDME